jgi:hypothetical protein
MATVLPMTAADWSKCFTGGREPIDARGEHRLDGRGNVCRVERPGDPEGSSLADEDTALDQRADRLLEEERIALGPVEEQSLERLERSARAEEAVQQLRRARRAQWIDAELRVAALTAPAVSVLGPVVDEQQHARGRKALDEGVEQPLRLVVDPVQVLEQESDGLDAALAQHDVLDGVEDPVPSLEGPERLP